MGNGLNNAGFGGKHKSPDKGKVEKEEGRHEAGNANIETAAQSAEMAEMTATAPELTPPVNYASVDVRL